MSGKMSRSIFRGFSLVLVVLLALASLPVSPAFAASSGPKNADTGNITGDSGGLIGNVVWTNPTFISVDNVSATAFLGYGSRNSTSYDLRGGSFGFQIPTNAAINGITLKIGRMADNPLLNEGIRDNSLRLFRGATETSSKASSAFWETNAITEVTYGGPADLWGITWTPAQINANDFGAAISAINVHSTSTLYRTASIDTLTITVTYTVLDLIVSQTISTYGDPISLTATLAGGLTSGANGRKIAFTLDSAPVAGCGSVSTSAAGVATCSPTGIAAGTHVVGASFTGDLSTTPPYYAASTGTGSLTVDPKTLTVTGITAANKPYDGTPDATLNVDSAALAGVVAGDGLTVVNLVKTGATGSFSDKDAANGKNVSVAGLTLAGTETGNYTLNQPVTTANITAIELTVTGVTAVDKIYDGSTDASLNVGSAILVGMVPGEGTSVVNLVTTAATGSFDDKDVADAKTVTAAGLTLAGPGAGNYTLAQPTTTGDITPRDLLVSASGVDKVYDGTTSATVTLSDDRVSGDVLTASYASASFSDPNVGPAKAVAVSGISLGGKDAINYTPNTTASASAAISPRPVTVTAAPKSKVFGSTDPDLTFTASPALISGDSITGALTREPGEDAGQYTIQKGTISAGDNYDLTYASAKLTITPADQAITINTHAPATAVNGATFSVAASSDSGLAVTYSAAGSCTNVGTTFTMTSGTGVCSVRYDQAGAGNYKAAPQVIESVNGVTAPGVTLDPQDVIVKPGMDASFTAAANGSPSATVQWQVSSDGGAHFNDLLGENSLTLILSTPPLSSNGYLYRAVFTNPGGSATTQAARLRLMYYTQYLVILTK